MKLSTSIKNAMIVADRIRSLSGIIETPEGQFSCVRIKRAWLFGSTARLKESPSDTDIILDINVTGYFQPTNSIAWRKRRCRNNSKTDKCFKRSTGINSPIDSKYIAFKYLRKNLKLVSLHSLDVDHEYATDKIMIYPRNDLTAAGLKDSADVIRIKKKR